VLSGPIARDIVIAPCNWGMTGSLRSDLAEDGSFAHLKSLLEGT